MEDVPVAVWTQWLQARQAVHHADRDSVKGEQTFYSKPLMRWMRAKRISPHYMRVTYYEVCPCRFS